MMQAKGHMFLIGGRDSILQLMQHRVDLYESLAYVLKVFIFEVKLEMGLNFVIIQGWSIYTMAANRL